MIFDDEVYEQAFERGGDWARKTLGIWLTYGCPTPRECPIRNEQCVRLVADLVQETDTERQRRIAKIVHIGAFLTWRRLVVDAILAPADS